MTRLEDIRFNGSPLRPRNRIEEALMPALKKIEASQLREPEPAPAPKPKKRILKKAFTFVFTAIALVVFVSGSLLIYRQYKASKVDAPDMTLTEVSKLMALPEGERPTIVTITDLAPLKDEAFFAYAEVGDKVLVYSTAKKAILYRPKANKVIIIAPLN